MFLTCGFPPYDPLPLLSGNSFAIINDWLVQIAYNVTFCRTQNVINLVAELFFMELIFAAETDVDKSTWGI